MKLNFFCCVTVTEKNPVRILATDEAKTAKISNFWTFWPVIQPIDHLITSGRTHTLWELRKR